MSDHSAAAPATEPDAPAGRFAFIQRLLARFKHKQAAPVADDTESTEAEGAAGQAAAPASGRFASISRCLSRLRKAPPAADAAAGDAGPPADSTESGAEPKPSALKALFDSPMKIALAAAVALLLVMLIVLVVVLVAKKSPKHPPAAVPHAQTPAAAEHKAAAEHVPAAADAHSAAASPADAAAAKSATAADAHGKVSGHGAASSATETSHEPAGETKPSGKLDKPIQLIHDPLAAERAKLAEERAALEKERAQLEAERKALGEQAGKALNGAVIGRSTSGSSTSNLAGKCDLSGDRASMRENLRRCLGLPEKPAEGKDGETSAKPAEKAGSRADKGQAAGH